MTEYTCWKAEDGPGYAVQITGERAAWSGFGAAAEFMRQSDAQPGEGPKPDPVEVCVRCPDGEVRRYFVEAEQRVRYVARRIVVQP